MSDAFSARHLPGDHEDTAPAQRHDRSPRAAGARSTRWRRKVLTSSSMLQFEMAYWFLLLLRDSHGGALPHQEIRYREGAVDLRGVLVGAEPDSRTRPGVLIVHGGAGLDAHARNRAQW